MKETRKQKLLKALEQYHGIVSTACKAAGVARATYYDWRRTDTEFAAAADDAQETAIDYVEGKLFDNIQDGDTTAIIFYLKTKGRTRGYNERIDQRLTMVNEDEGRMTWDDVVRTINGAVDDDVEQTQ